MRITKISVKKLFGVFDHEIPLNRDSRITIIHGPNGFGKTMLLRMIHGLFTSKLNVFVEVPFREFRVEFDTNEAVIVRSESATRGERRRSIIFDDGRLATSLRSHPNDDHESGWFESMREKVSTHLIGTQRLWSGIAYEPDLEQRSSHELSLVARHKVHEHSESFAQRVHEEMERFDSSIAQLEKLESELEELGSLESAETTPIGVIDKRKIDILERLKNIMDDSQRAWSSSLERNELATLLKQTIDGLFTFKELLFGEEGGFVIASPDGKTIPLTSLSSGEQHQLVLFYELLFLVPRGSLVMIDEPELSLHVTWQRRFIDDIRETVRLRNFDVLIATHSPQIVNDKYDWMVDLHNPENELADDVFEYA